ncbi:MAG: relaxase/mobilization nuclease domain-containing protein [Asticcacaulis sp.]
MIIKGGPRGKGAQLADHLMRTDTNETVKVVGARGVYSKTVKGALAEMEGVAAGSKVTKPLYHVSINPEADERLTLEQWERAADRLEKALGLDGHQRVLVQHLKQGKDGTAREHMHVVWCGVDVATMKAAHHSHNYRTHEEVARDLEREFGLKRTQGVHAELDGAEKPKQRRDRTKDSMQEAVTGWKKADARAAIAAAWNAGKTGGSFKAYLEEAGYQLALGDKRDFVVIDPAGGVHSIRSGVNPTRRGEKGLTVAEIRARFGDLDPKTLPSVAEAKEIAKANYPAFKAARQAEEVKRVFPAKPARPAQPTPTPPTWTRNRLSPRPR